MKCVQKREKRPTQPKLSAGNVAAVTASSSAHLKAESTKRKHKHTHIESLIHTWAFRKKEVVLYMILRHKELANRFAFSARTDA
jgi:hypothetical protein